MNGIQYYRYFNLCILTFPGPLTVQERPFANPTYVYIYTYIYMSPDTFTCTTDININVHVYLCLCMYTYMYMSLFDQHFVVLYQQNQDRSKFKALSDGK